MTITTDGGTTFTVELGNVTIIHPGQATVTIPLADLQELMGLLDLEDADDFEGDEE